MKIRDALLMNSRIRTIAGMLVTVAAGLASRKVAKFFDAGCLFYIGDALWSILVYQLILLIKPEIEEKKAALTCLGISYLVEASQLIHQKDLDMFRQTRIGHWVLGNGYDPFDLLAYTAGVAVFYMIRTRVIMHKTES